MTGPELTSWRKSRGWTQTQLAQALGVTRWSIARYEAAEEVPRVVEMALKSLRMSRTSHPIQNP